MLHYAVLHPDALGLLKRAQVKQAVAERRAGRGAVFSSHRVTEHTELLVFSVSFLPP